jgi:hypothetical protein
MYLFIINLMGVKHSKSLFIQLGVTLLSTTVFFVYKEKITYNTADNYGALN